MHGRRRYEYKNVIDIASINLFYISHNTINLADYFLSFKVHVAQMKTVKIIWFAWHLEARDVLLIMIINWMDVAHLPDLLSIKFQGLSSNNHLEMKTYIWFDITPESTLYFILYFCTYFHCVEVSESELYLVFEPRHRPPLQHVHSVTMHLISWRVNTRSSHGLLSLKWL